MNHTLPRLMVCLSAVLTMNLPAAAQQLPLGQFDSAPGQSSFPRARPQTAIPRPVPLLTGPVEPSLSNPNPRASTQPEYQQPGFAPDPRYLPGSELLPGSSVDDGNRAFSFPESGNAGQVDPITGLPLHLLSRRPDSPGVPQAGHPPSQTPFFIPGGVPLPQPLSSPSNENAMPFQTGPLVTPPLPEDYSYEYLRMPSPGSVPPTTQRIPGPILFEGRIESPPQDRIADSDFDWGSLDAPIPRIDPPLPEFGNGDGTLDLYDIIEEYTGRATHSGIPDQPHLTHPDQRSWLRIEDWRTEIGWLAGSDDQLGIASARGSIGIGLAKMKGIVLRPIGASYWLSGPVRTDLPSRVYDAELEATWMHRFNDRFRMHVSGRAGLYSDFNTSRDMEKGLRVSGTGIGAWEVNPDLQIVLGVAYFNLGSVWAWPVAGIVYQPTDKLRLELLFPEARISALVNETEFFTERTYLGAKFFGRTWLVDRTNGMRERVTYQDWRFTAGHEIRYMYGITSFFEFGYAFNRELEYRSGIGDYDLDGVAMVSAGLYY